MLINYDTLKQQPLVDNFETIEDIGSSLTYADLEKAGVIKEVTSLSDLIDALSGDEPLVSIEIKEDIELGKNDRIIIPAGKTAYVRLGKELDCTVTGFKVEEGASLTLTGDGTIKTSNKSTAGSMIEAKGAGTKVVIDGVTLDAVSVNGKTTANCNHAIYLMDDAEIEFKSGLIKTAYGSCITTNNTTGIAKITISGGELHSDGSYALYIPSQCTVDIKGDAIVQGINARMGIFNIGEDAKIIGTTLTSEDCDPIGKEFATSGCVWLGDTIAVMAGTYEDSHGTDCKFNISGNATVESSFRAAVGIYEVDTKQAQNILVKGNAAAISTTDPEFEAVKVYDHDYIAEDAQKYGKTYTPVAQSTADIQLVA